MKENEGKRENEPRARRERINGEEAGRQMRKKTDVKIEENRGKKRGEMINECEEKQGGK